MTAPDDVLIVDDDPEIRSLLSEYLQKNGYRTTAVGDGRAMRAAIAVKRSDLIVLDIMLPGRPRALPRPARAFRCARHHADRTR